MKEVLNLALEALEGYESCIDGYYAEAVCPQIDKAITAIKEALAQPEHEWLRGECVKCGQSIEKQEPLAWAEFDGEGGYHFRAYEDNEDYAEQWDKRNPNHVGWVKPLYEAPPQRTTEQTRQWVGLTVEEKQSAIWTDGGFGGGALWAEAKLKEKNT